MPSNIYMLFCEILFSKGLLEKNKIVMTPYFLQQTNATIICELNAIITCTSVAYDVGPSVNPLQIRET
jgi:hypothetical protein